MTKYKKIAFVFPGQGSQYPGMGRDFFEKFQVAKETFEEADDLLKIKLSSIILDGPVNLLTETKNSQTGIFVTSIALLRVIQQEFPSLKPSVTAGLSLGEYTALCASNRLSFSECLPLVAYRGQYMNDACGKRKGTMAVVLGFDEDKVQSVLDELNMPNDLYIANLNCPGQIVVSGTEQGIQAFSLLAKEKGAKRVLPLAVHGAFHSGLMEDARLSLAPHIYEAPIKDSSIDFVMNVTGNFVKNVDAICENLIAQVTHPVRWESSINEMKKALVDCYIEIGPGKTLGAMIKRIGVDVPSISIEKLSDLELLA